MADAITIQGLIDGRLDIKSLGEAANGDENTTIVTRTGETYPSAKKAIKTLFESVGFVKKSTFVAGGTVSEFYDTLVDSNGSSYRWGGSLPKVVPAGSSPETTGGFALNAWVAVNDAMTRQDFAKPDGAGEVGYDDSISYPAETVGAKIAAMPKVTLGRIAVSSDKIFKLTNGSYSWWNEPQTCQIGVYQKTVVGAVDAITGNTKALIIDSSKTGSPISTAYLKNKDDYVPDEHNAPVTVEAGSTIITFIPSHNDVNYLPYRVSQDGNPENLGPEQKIMSPDGMASYAQAFYSAALGKVFVAFRASGVNGVARSWYLAQSADWFADSPTWVVNELFTDTDQLYLRLVPHSSDGIMRCLLTKNASYKGNNGLWFAYIALTDGTVKTTQSATVGTVGVDVINLTDLTKIYTAINRIRLYDAQTQTSKLPILMQEFDTYSGGGAYRYLELEIGGTWSITKDVEIVQSGTELAPNTGYYGGAHFSNVTGLGFGAKTVGEIYLAREDGGTWYLEEWDTGDAGLSWQKIQTIDSSAIEKIWRPRVPFNTRRRYAPDQIILTWCKGIFTTYKDYDSGIYALKR